MKDPIPQFYSGKDKGHIIFVIPFNFISDENENTNLCEQFFGDIIPEEKKFLDNGNRNAIKNLYEGYKEKLCLSLKEDALFSGACPTLEALSWCTFCKGNKRKDYQGRNLCDCLSISRRFHDDRSQFTPRLEVLLGEYDIRYGEKKAFFYFKMAASLLLYGEKGNECGFLMYSIPMASIEENGFGSATGNELDNIIFLKHLFYKQRLEVSINSEKKLTSLQAWTENYCSRLLPILGIHDYKRAFNNSINFRYSMIELNNIVDEEGNLVSLTNMKAMMQTYHRQLYGILVSDEGWKNTPDEEINSLFGHNYWTSRDYACTIVLNRNAILINQYKSPECVYNREYATEWMSHYKGKINDLDFYKQYLSLEPCIPGVSTLAFDAYLRCICKEMKIDIAKSRTEGDKETLEKRFLHLSNTLQTYSMSLDVIHSLEDMICAQFGLQGTLNNLRERYTREANNMQNHANDLQNERISQLTIITASISIAALLASFMGIILTILDYKKGFIYTLRHCLDINFWGTHLGYLWGLIVVIAITVATVIGVYFIVKYIFEKYWNKNKAS